MKIKISLNAAKVAFLAAFALLFLNQASAQNLETWQQKMLDPSVNFYQAKDAFNQYWSNRPYERSKGYKAFKRWEYFMEQRCYPTGERFRPDAVAIAMQENPDIFVNSLVAGSWTYIGNTAVPNGGGAGRVNSLRNLPGSTSTFFACAPGGGLWKSTNSGTSWSLMNTDFLASIGVSDVAIDPSNTNIMYIATGDGDASDTYSLGVWKSIDAGATWSATGLNWQVTQTRTTNRILIDPNNSQVLIAATSNGIWRTANAGTTWTQIVTGSFKDIKFKPGDTQTVYAAAGTSFYKSTNNGVSFSAITSGLPTGADRLAISVSANNPAYVYILASDNATDGLLGVYRSTDSGTTFSQRMGATPNILGWDNLGGDTGGQGWYDLRIECDETNAETIYTGGVNIWKSTNGGTSFTCVGHWYGAAGLPYVHADCHALFWVPGTTRLLVGCDGGAFTTTNGGSTFQDISSNLQIAQQYRLGVSQTNANKVITGWQDNGTNLKNGATWSEVLGGDGMEAAISPVNENIMYGEIYYGSISRTTNGVSWSNIVASNGAAGTVGEQGAWVTPYVLGNPSTNMFVGKSRVYKSTDSGTTFTAMSAFGSGNINALAVAASDQNTVYASKSATLYKTTNGNTFTQLTGLPNQTITYIAVHPTDPLRVWVTMSGYTAGSKVFYSSNGGAAWTNISGSLPNIPANCIAVQNNTNESIYVGTDAGIFYRDNTFSDWISYNTNLPNVEIMELEIQASTAKILAATFGRGLWSAPLYSLPALDASISIAAPTGNYCSADVTPQISVVNAGNATLTTLTFNYQVTGQALQTYTWTGSLVSGASATIALSTFNYGTGSFSFSVNLTDINGAANDDVSSNNSAASTYTVILAPLNDACTGASTLVVGAAATSTTNATTCNDGPEPGCGGTGIKDVWFKFVYTGGTVNITTTLGGLTDTRIALYSSCGTSPIACSDDISSSNYASSITASCPTLVSGQTYYIQAGGYGTGTGTFSIRVTSTPILGCTNPSATNYAVCATQDNGTCTIPGCTNSAACNYNALATISDGSCILPTTYYRDLDGDGYGNSAVTQSACSIPGGYVSNSSDCNDNNASVKPGATELCNALDDNCNSQIDEGLPTPNWYTDADGDGYGAGNAIPNCSQPVGTVSNNLDCNDANSAIKPSATEFCNAIDDNCNAQIDEGVQLTFYQDSDGDGFGNSSVTALACSSPVGYVSNSTDCNDANSAIHPNAIEVCNSIDDNCNSQIDEGTLLVFYLDSDGDGYGVAGTSSLACSAPIGYATSAGDCNNASSSVFPGQIELCNSIDDNCDGQIDEGFDGDGDGYSSCEGDCNDGNVNINPGALEQCNSVDDNCNAQIDEGVVTQSWYADTDGDGFGAGVAIVSCSAPVGRVSNNLDCNNTNAAINPSEIEICDAIDNDCDGLTDEGFDADGDGFTICQNDCNDNSSAIHPGALESCNSVDDNCSGSIDEGFDVDGDGYSTCLGDCNDSNAAVHPGMSELCNNIDDNCNGAIDESLTTTAWYIDLDSDGYGAGTLIMSCLQPVGYVANNADCNDANFNIKPSAVEVCNTIDDDCDGSIDEGVITQYYLDQDGDGFGNSSLSVLSCTPLTNYVTNSSDCNDGATSVHPGILESCNGIDDNCNGQIDEGCNVVVAPSNDNFSFPKAVILPQYPSCFMSSNTLAGATASTESAYVPTVSGAGQDVWFRVFLPAVSSGIMRISVVSSSNDVAVILQKEQPTFPYYQHIATENVLGSIGSEFMTASGLTTGATYRICVKNMGTQPGNNFQICVSHLKYPTCGSANGPGSPYSICQTFSASYTGASQYTFTYTNTTNPQESFSKTISGTNTSPASSVIALNSVLGLSYGSSYHVAITGTYHLPNAIGTVQTIALHDPASDCVIYTMAQPAVALAMVDQCAQSTKRLTSFISTDWVCGAIDYQWEISQVIGDNTPHTTLRGAASRFILVGSLAGINSGATSFSVRVRPIFSDGVGGIRYGNYGTTAILCIVPATGTGVNESFITVEADNCGFEIFPNPSSGHQFSIVSDQFNGQAIIRVMDGLGRVVHAQNAISINKTPVLVKFSNELAEGLYFVEIVCEGRRDSIKLVISD